MTLLQQILAQQTLVIIIALIGVLIFLAFAAVVFAQFRQMRRRRARRRERQVQIVRARSAAQVALAEAEGAPAPVTTGSQPAVSAPGSAAPAQQVATASQPASGTPPAPAAQAPQPGQAAGASPAQPAPQPEAQASGETKSDDGVSSLLSSVFSEEDGSQKYEALIKVIHDVDMNDLAKLSQKVAEELHARIKGVSV